MEILSAILVLLGLLGSFLPILPGPPLSFAGLFIYAYINGFSEIKSGILIIFGLLTLLSLILDYIAPVLGAKGQKASKYGVWGAFIGSFVGIFFTGFIGLFLGPLIGGFIGEYFHKRDVGLALKSAWGAFMGFLAGTIFRLVISLSIAIYFLSKFLN